MENQNLVSEIANVENIAEVVKTEIVKKEKKAKAPKADAPKKEISTALPTLTDKEKKALDALNAKFVAGKLASNGKKTIFKKEFANKKDRSKCRSMFINAVEMFVIQFSHNKKDDANNYLNKAKEIAIKYYIAEDKFQSASDYYTENMGEESKNNISLFITLVNKNNKPKK